MPSEEDESVPVVNSRYSLPEVCDKLPRTPVCAADDGVAVRLPFDSVMAPPTSAGFQVRTVVVVPGGANARGASGCLPPTNCGGG